MCFLTMSNAITNISNSQGELGKQGQVNILPNLLPHPSIFSTYPLSFLFFFRPMVVKHRGGDVWNPLHTNSHKLAYHIPLRGPSISLTNKVDLGHGCSLVTISAHESTKPHHPDHTLYTSCSTHIK